MLPPEPHSRTPDTTGEFTEMESLFTSLAVRAPSERAQVLAHVAAPMRDQVLALLAAHDRFADDDPSDAPSHPSLTVGDAVGPYRLLERVGAGGMGEVFRAERADGVFAQEVAVKITRTHVGDPDLLRRFGIERQILATLQHPNIVRLLDGGATPQGQAYLIMEFVKGAPITRYAARQQLSLAARLQLFCAVCSAVQHAHQRGVVHRDLKPANILVGDDGVPKVVDFGIAKLIEARAGAAATIALLPGPMTPNYASPEQLRGLAVTTASDVYALGVVLYELLAGIRPYETEGQPLDRIVQMVVHDDAPRPSAAGGRQDRSPTPYTPRRLQGDLDAIVAKAMSKDADRRYTSAGELALDLQRWLAGDPVLARARSTSYVLRRLAARHRAAVATAAVALLAVVGALGVAAWQWQSARAAQITAEQRLRDVRQLANALIFKIQAAVAPLPGSTPVRRTIVDEAVRYLARLEPDAADDPALRLELAAAYRQLGNVLGNPSVANLGDREGAIAQYERARELVLPLVTAVDDFDVTAAVVNGNVTLATLYGVSDRSRAQTLASEALAHVTNFRNARAREERVELLVGQVLFSIAVHAQEDQRIGAWTRALEHYEGMLARKPEDPQLQRNVALVGKYLGSVYETHRQHAAARPHYERSLALDAARLKSAPDRRDVQFDAAISYSNLASVAEALDDFAAAGPLFEQSLALRRQVSEADPENAQAASRLGYVLWRVAGYYRRRGEPDRAVELARESVEVLSRLYRKTGDRPHAVDLASGLRELMHAERLKGGAHAGCASSQRLQAFLQEAAKTHASTFTTHLSEDVRKPLSGCT